MTPEEAKKLLSDWETLVTVRSDFDQKLIAIVRDCIEAARIVERERCAKLFRDNIYLVTCKEDVDALEQKLISP